MSNQTCQLWEALERASAIRVFQFLRSDYCSPRCSYHISVGAIMRGLLTRLLSFLLCFSTAVALSRAERSGQQNFGPFSSAISAVRADDALAQRFTKLGNLPDHDADETNRFNCEFVNDKVGWLVNGAKLWRTTDDGASWKLVYSKGKASFFDSEYISHLEFVSPTTGWMLVNHKLYRTDDGGDTWRSLPTPKMDFLETFDFLPGGELGWLGGTVCEPMQKDESTANRFYCGGGLRHAGDIAALFITRNGGQTWQRQPVTRRFGDIRFVKMRDASHGFAIGQAGTFRYQHRRWIVAESAILELENPEETPGEYSLQVQIGMPTFCPVNFRFTDNLHGYISNTNGYFGRTNDGGRTWIDIARSYEEGRELDPPYFMQFFIAPGGWGLALDSEGGLQETFDGGVTWDRLANRGIPINLFALKVEKVWVITSNGIYRLKPEHPENASN